jgi:aryl-alcohol dehydrogenase
MKITAAVVRQKTGPFLLDLNKMGRFPIDKMVKYYKFSDISQAVEDSEKGRPLKTIITM